MTEPSDTPDDPNEIAVNALTDLTQRVAALESVKPAARPWWQDIITLIAILTFVFSLATTAFSFIQANQQRKHDLHTELRDITSRITQLPREQFAFDNQNIATSFTLTPTLQQQRRQRSLELMIQSERGFLVGQATAIVRLIPDDVTSAEYSSLAGALHTVVNNSHAENYYDEAVKRASTDAEYVGAMRSKAGMEFELKQIPEGRSSYEKVIARLQSADEQIYLGSAAYTELLWAEGELNSKNCVEFNDHFAKADKLATELKTKGFPGESIDGFAPFLKQRAASLSCQIP